MVVNVEGPVYGLQCTAEAPLGSVPELAAFYLTKVKTIQPKGPYYMAGYSFGASVAFEVASQIEKSGEKVNSLVMLDGSHSYVTAQVSSYASRDTDSSKHEAEAICAFILQFTSIDYAKVCIFLCLTLCSAGTKMR